ncbi:MAG: tail fiber protein [Chitinophagales bacterium]|nr:tail fiber protein [Chitinophagales bacterium]
MKNLLSILFIALALQLAAQAPQSFSYQAVARDVTGQLLVNQNVAFQITILSGSASGTVKYAETHFATTDDHGLVHLQIGEGNTVLGSMANIAWGSDLHFLRVEVDVTGGSTFIPVSTTQLLSVPYALYADKAGSVDEVDGDSTNELQVLSKSGNNLVLSRNGGTVSLNDEDPTNELQTLSKNGTTVSLSNGGSFVLGDDNSSNELQTISKNGNTVTLSNNGGSFVLNDDDDTNELQSISRNGDTLILSQFGGNVFIGDADADPSNELQTLSKNGTTLSLTGGGNITLGDESPNNELQTISKTGVVATLSQGGGSFISPDTLGLNYIICVNSTYYPNITGNNTEGAFLGEIKLFAGNYAPDGWMLCQGQTMQISTNTGLFAVLGTRYGGDGLTTFALPDLRSRVPIQR